MLIKISGNTRIEITNPAPEKKNLKKILRLQRTVSIKRMKSHLLMVLIFGFALCNEPFEIVDRYPPFDSSPDETVITYYVKEGESMTLSCTSSQKFNLCRWGRPGSQTPCGIFSDEEGKDCGKTSSMAR